MEKIGTSLKGIYRDILLDRDNKIIFDRGWVNNLIVDRCRVLLAAFMKNADTVGIYSLKIGRGDPAWDKGGAPAPSLSDVKLKDNSYFEILSKDLEIEYLNEQNEESTTPTARLQITATLGIDQPPPPAGSGLSSYPMREFGLFGKIGKKDQMIDIIRHPVIHKDASTTLVRVIRLYF